MESRIEEEKEVVGERDSGIGGEGDNLGRDKERR